MELSELKKQTDEVLTTPMDFRSVAMQRLSKGVFDFIDGGAGNESTIDRNRQAIQSIHLTGQLLKDAFQPCSKVSVFGLNLAFPFAIAPMAYHGMVDEEGEMATARAAAKANIPFILSTMSTVGFSSLKEVQGVRLWFQLYAMKDAKLTYSMIDEAIEGGCELLVLTIDVPVFGRRLRDERNAFKPSTRFTLTNKVRQAGAKMYGQHLLDLDEVTFVDRMFKQDLTWQDIEEICRYSRIPVVLKGVMSEHDALCAQKAGAAGVIVSNHGGRQFDAHPATLSLLPHIAKSVEPSYSLGVDGGFESASDIIKGMALGADLVLLGRVVMYALAAGGEALLTQYLQALTKDVIRSMTLLGLRSFKREEINTTLTLYPDSH